MASRPRKRWDKPKYGGLLPGGTAAARASSHSWAVFWARHWRYLAVLWTCSVIPYLNSFTAGLVFDNNVAIRLDSRVHAATWANFQTIWTTDYWYNSSSTGLYRPLTTLSYLFNYAVLGNGLTPAGYHLFNLAVQALNVGLVYGVGLCIFEEITPAFVMALLWALHPLLTESVTNIVGRADLLAAFGVLSALLIHIHAGSQRGGRRVAWFAALAFAVEIGIFSKEIGIVAVAAMLLYDVAFPQGWRARIGGYAASAIPIGLFFYFRERVFAVLNTGQVPGVDNPLVVADFWVGRLTAIKVIGKYLWLFLWPAHLSADYSYNQIPVRVDWQGILSLLICCAAIVLAAVAMRRSTRLWRALFFFIGFFFATLAPTANVFLLIGAIMAERFLYLPLIALAGCLAVAILLVYRRLPAGPSQTAAAAVVALLALLWAGRTFVRNFDWHDEHSLWAASAIAAPNSFKPHLLLASDSLGSSNPDLDLAVKEAGRSLEIIATLPDSRNSARPYATAGEADRRKGDSLPDGPERRQWYVKALNVLLRGQSIDLNAKQTAMLQAGAQGRRVISAAWEPLYLELGRVYSRLGDWDKALEALRYGRSVRQQAEFFDEMAGVYEKKGDSAQAEITLLEGFIADPSATGFVSRLTALYTKFEPQSCAVSRSGNSPASLDLNCPLVHGQVCTAARNVSVLYLESGKRNQAAATARTAVDQMACPAGLFQ
jgi:tetratricopeptide (TPR) repeat protein